MAVGVVSFEVVCTTASLGTQETDRAGVYPLELKRPDVLLFQRKVSHAE
jgi:hypothetical protein